jgi:hypothetical protein
MKTGSENGIPVVPHGHFTLAINTKVMNRHADEHGVTLHCRRDIRVRAQ